MKTTVILSILLVLSSSLMAKDINKNIDIGLTNIKVFNDEEVPALSLGVKSKSIKKVDIMLAYTNKLLIEQTLQAPTKSKNPEREKLYVSLTYKF